MKTASLYGAFNARWLTPEEVARTFVPISQFGKLIQTQHSMLMGPRGCGKTTLLKMLTRSAQNSWLRRIEQETDLESRFSRPDFEAIYIPSDIRWSQELSSIGRKDNIGQPLTQNVERALVALTSLIEITRVFENLANTNKALTQEIAIAFIENWHFREIVPTLSQIRLEFQSWAARITKGVNREDPSSLAATIESLPDAFTAHAAEPLIFACSLFEAAAPRDLVPARWALCFDELEIAPSWLQDELLGSLRSIDQRFLLKLTWGQVLPQHLITRQQLGGDFAAIRVWHSHAMDARGFCQELGRRLLRDRLGVDASPERVFGHSLFAEEERVGQKDRVYSRRSPVWKAMVELAKRDPSFQKYLKNQRLNPKNPVTDNTKKKDACLRKIKPIVLLRETFWKAERARSRKRPRLYAGAEAIYAMSDGNPRWLAGLLNDLLDEISVIRGTSKLRLAPRPGQARVLSAASRRMQTFVKSSPLITPSALRGTPPAITLFDLVDQLGDCFKNQVLGPVFKGEPAGSFIVDDGLSPELIRLVETGQLLGVFVYVGLSPMEVAPSILGARMRLSFMLSPSYMLLFRNYRALQLSAALNIYYESRQLDLFEKNGATSASANG